ncbi:zinc-binding alcohol dehydrogenase family protein, partial [Acinetobacter baumannii]|nr:zinc-binding alcohol dehydrogenase family protein [Acinetobacter baumannii]
MAPSFHSPESQTGAVMKAIAITQAAADGNNIPSLTEI